MRILQQIPSNEFAEEEHGFTLKIFVLGAKKNQIDILIDGRYLWISAKQTPASDFQKPYLLPNNALVESARAICHEGFLTIHFQKGISKERANPIKVKVKSQLKFTTSLINGWRNLREIVRSKFNGNLK